MEGGAGILVSLVETLLARLSLDRAQELPLADLGYE
jgi:hypothetical protein